MWPSGPHGMGKQGRVFWTEGSASAEAQKQVMRGRSGVPGVFDQITS